MGKVFGIGLSRTGTQSLGAALSTLGYRNVHYPFILRYRCGRVTIDRQVLDQADSFTDTPIAAYYWELDRLYPGSRFVLTVRDQESWLDSVERHFVRNRKLNEWYDSAPHGLDAFLLPLWGLRRSYEASRFRLHPTKATDIIKPLVRKKIFGRISFERVAFAAAYERHLQGVQHHFEGRESDLLTIDIVRGEGWEPLCRFLGRPIPEAPFPKIDHVKSSLVALRDRLASEGQRPGGEPR